MLFMFLTGSMSSIELNVEAGRDSWIAAIIAGAFSAGMFYIYTRPLIMYPDMDIFDAFKKIYGKTLGKVIIWFYAAASILMCADIINVFSQFVSTILLFDTPKFIISGLMSACCIMLVKSGAEVLSRWSEVALPVVAVLMVFLIIFTAPYMDIGSIKPFFFDGARPVLEGAWGIFATPFSEAFFLISLFYMLKEKKDIRKSATSGLAAAAVFLTVIYISNISILNFPIMSEIKYPSFQTASLINIGSYLQREEVLVSVNFLPADILRATVCMLFSCKALCNIRSKKDYRMLAAPVGFLAFSLSLVMFENMVEADVFFSCYKYYILGPFVILPALTWAIAAIRTRKRKKKMAT